jgi:hypothetical protein
MCLLRDNCVWGSFQQCCDKEKTDGIGEVSFAVEKVLSSHVVQISYFKYEKKMLEVLLHKGNITIIQSQVS